MRHSSVGVCFGTLFISLPVGQIWGRGSRKGAGLLEKDEIREWMEQEAEEEQRK